MYSIRVKLEDPEPVISAGYQLCVSKAAQGSEKEVQWLGITLVGATTKIAWSEEYQVFFTSTQITNGAVIEQGSEGSANLGTSYTYNHGVFKDTGTTSQDSVVIVNGLDTAQSFGIAQAANINNSPTEVSSPVGICTILPAGNGTFTPLQTITVYLSKTNTSAGCITDAQSIKSVATIKASHITEFVYTKNGSWTNHTVDSDHEADNEVPYASSPLVSFNSLYLIQASFKTAIHLSVPAFTRAIDTYAKEAGIAIFKTPRHAKNAEFKFVFAGTDLPSLRNAVLDLLGKKVERKYKVVTQGGHRFAGISTTVSAVTIEERKPSIALWNNGIRKLLA